MSITIYQSTEKRAESTTQDALNDLAEFWDTTNWGEIVRDETTNVVTQLWLNDTIYIGKNSASNPTLCLYNETLPMSQACSGVINPFIIVRTDNGLLIRQQTDTRDYIVVAPVIDINGGRSMGAMLHKASDSYLYLYTKHMTTAQVSISTGLNNDAAYWTILTRIGSRSCSDRFTDDIMRVTQYKSSDGGKALIGDNSYYLIPSNQYCGLALKYT